MDDDDLLEIEISDIIRDETLWESEKVRRLVAFVERYVREQVAEATQSAILDMEERG